MNNGMALIVLCRRATSLLSVSVRDLLVGRTTGKAVNSSFASLIKVNALSPIDSTRTHCVAQH
jgi:hypothetical protein